MNCRHSLRCAVVGLILTALVLSSVFVAYSARGADFSLSDLQVKANRLFEVVLSCRNTENLSAFVADILYDSAAVSFDSASVSDKSAQYSVNSLNEGRLTAVYLNEDGASCTENTALMSFKFKALQTGSTEIQLSVRDAVTSFAEDVEVIATVSAQVVITDSASDSKGRSGNSAAVNTDSQHPDTTEEDESALEMGTTRIGGASLSNQTMIAAALAFLCTLCVAVYVAYKIGVHRQKEKQKPVPLSYKDNTGNDEKSD